MRTIARFIVAAACLALLGEPAAAQSKPRLQDISGFMSRGVFTELDPEQMKHRISQAELETLHFDGKATSIEDILKFMAKAEKMRSKIDEPLEVRGEIPLTLPPNTTGDEAYTTCFYAFNLNGLLIAGSGGELILIRPETQRKAPRLERTWNREQILPIRLFRLGYLNPHLILAQYEDKLGTRAGRAILEPKSNLVLVSDKAASLEKLARYIDAEALAAMGVPTREGQIAADSLRHPSLGAIASRAAIHFYLLAFARVSQIPMSGSKKEGTFDKHYPEGDLWIGEPGYRELETEFRRIDRYYQLARRTRDDWPVPSDERTLAPAQQNRLDIHFGVILPDPANAPAGKTKAKAKKTARKR